MLRALHTSTSIECNQIFADKVGPTMIKYDKCEAKRNSLVSAGTQ